MSAPARPATLRIAAATACVTAAFVAIPAEARPHRARTQASAGRETAILVRPGVLTPADRARSGWIDGASPFNPEGSSNPQIPNNN